LALYCSKFCFSPIAPSLGSPTVFLFGSIPCFVLGAYLNFSQLVKIFSLFLTTALFMKIFNYSRGCIGLLICYLGLAPSYFSLLLKSLIKTVILKRGAKILLPSLKTPPPQISAPQYFKGQ